MWLDFGSGRCNLLCSVLQLLLQRVTRYEMSAERKKNPGLFAQVSNKGTGVDKNDNHCKDNIYSDYRTISMPDRGKRKISCYLAMISIVDRSNGDDVTKLVPP